jgi:hypothetical protein
MTLRHGGSIFEIVGVFDSLPAAGKLSDVTFMNIMFSLCEMFLFWF